MNNGTNNQINFDPATGQPIQANQPMNNNQMPGQQMNPGFVPNNVPVKKKSPLKIVLIALGAFAAVGVLVVCLVLFGVIGGSKKLVCTSEQGNITLMYNDNQILGYTSKGISYDLEGQKAIAKEKGIEEYLTEFETWFTTNTTGVCVRK